MSKASDNPFPSILLTEGTVPTSPAASKHRLYVDTADDKLKRVDSAGTVSVVEGSTPIAYSSYTPAITATTTNPTLGTGGAITGRYFQSGRQVVGDAVILFGTSGTNAGSGSYRVSIPVAASVALDFSVMGSAYMYDGSSILRTGVLSRVSSTTVQVIMDGAAGAATHAVPWAWGVNDLLVIHFAYESAS